MGNNENNKLFFYDIEKLRGLACILVLVQHIAWICPLRFTYNVLPFEFLIGSGGVHIFFAISGFVVTLSLIDKLKFADNSNFQERLTSSKQWLMSFYTRRVYRLLPVLIVVALMLAIFLACTEKDWFKPFIRMPMEIFMGVYNYSMEYFVPTERVHFGGSGPFWTLAVELQFYLLWPIALLLCKTHNARIIMSLGLGCFFLFVAQPSLIILFGYKYYAIYDNISELFLGSFFALIYDKTANHQQKNKFYMVLAMMLVMIVWVYPNLIDGHKYFYVHTVVSIASVATLVLAVFAEGSYNVPLLGKLTAYLGSRSYSFYMVQLTLANIIVWFTNSIYFPKESFSEYDFYKYQLIIFMVALFIVTELLYRFVEKPLRNLGK